MSEKKFKQHEPAAPRPARPDFSKFSEDLRHSVEVLRNGGVILYPTDTVWGLGCDATNPEAVKRVYDIKHRADSKALISLVDSEGKVERYVRDVPRVAWDVIELSERPTTIILDGARGLAENLLADDGSVALRVTREAFSKELCHRFGRAIVSTSANISGEPSPKCFDDISQEVRDHVDYIVKYRQKEHSKATPSVIIKLGSEGEVKVIRQ